MTIIEMLRMMRNEYVKSKVQGFTVIELKFDDLIPMLNATIEYIENLEKTLSEKPSVILNMAEEHQERSI